ncbi:MAG: tripartite tricarboxylate transporter permease [Clostridia bacterium]|nr:tripartite tricarboxylate transporter permease [Clostridia bacterium]
MIEHLLYGFSHLADPMLLMLIVVSLAGGIVIGALPGFSPTMGVALLVPFTFAMTPVEGLTVLAGVYTGAVYGGSISAILLNIPGAPANIATLFDGYPMAQKGEGRKALLASAIASAHGGFLSAIALLIFAPLLAVVALKFGAAEKFWVAVFGLVIIASLGTGKELIKGLVSGGFGVWLGMIGTSPSTGEPRFTFGIMDLWGGINLIPALVGFFAFTQVLIYFENIMQSGERQIIQAPTKKGDIWALYKETWLKFKKLQLFTGILGTILGIIPGAGGQVGGIVAYDQAKRFSKNPSEYGTGKIEGVIAPECANNATVGGSLIPLLTLGIPGSPTAAVLLGGLLIHGLWPGPLLFSVNGEITFTFMAAFLLSQIALLFVAIVILNYAAHILKVKDFYLGPSVIALCLFGSFAVNNNFFDIYVMLVLGIIGYFFLKIGILPAPAVLGLILGRIAEESFILGMRTGLAKDGVWHYFFSRPISLGVIAIILAVVASTIWMERNRLKAEKMARAVNGKVDEEVNRAPRGILSQDAILGMVLLAICILTWQLYLTNLSKEAAIFPTVTFAFLGIVAVVQIIFATFVYSDPPKWIPWKVIGEVSIATAITIVLAKTLGFYTVTFLLMVYIGYRMVVYSGKSGIKHLHKLILFGIGAVLTLYLAFGLFLYLPTPRGILF